MTGQEPRPHRIEDLVRGAVLGASTVFVAGLSAVVLVALFSDCWRLDSGYSDRWRPTNTEFAALVVAAALIIAALIGRSVVGRRRGAASVAGACAFAVVTALGVATSPLTQADEGATGLAAVAAAALWGAAFIRLERGVPADGYPRRREEPPR